MILAVGLDLVEIDRFRTSLERGGVRFRERLFTPREQALARPLGREAEFLAGRFAAKEAVLKCLGTGWSQGVAWRDVEILSTPGGAPELSLAGRAAEVAAGLGFRGWTLSITHTERTAAAVAVAHGPDA